MNLNTLARDGSLYIAMATYLVLSAAQIANVPRSKTFPIREIGYDSVLFNSNFLIKEQLKTPRPIRVAGQYLGRV